MRAPSSSKFMKPPTGGWDRKNALADMPEDNAYILDNLFPSTDRMLSPPPWETHATGLGDSVETLLPYTPQDGTSEIYAVAGGSIYDVSSAGAVGAAEVSGLTNSRFQYTQLTNAAGHHLIAGNGSDTPRLYSGSSWGTLSVTGPTAANLVWFNNHQRRLWAGEKSSLRAWYLAVDSISGAMSSFDLGAHATKGGYLVGMGTWTRDSGSGPDDAAVFLTSEGQAIVYAGTDPSSASTWALIGVFDIGRPIGRRCMIKWGGDLVIVTQDAFVPASRSLLSDRSSTDTIAISSQINEAVNDAVRLYGSNFGWEPFVYPRGAHLMFNIPVSSTTSHQYVFNTITGKPCRYTYMPALCWALAGDDAYFGTPSGTVCKFDSGAGADGSDIMSDVLQAFSHFGTPGRDKAFKRVELTMQAAADPNPAIEINTDYQVKAFTAVNQSSPNTAATWGVARWGIGTWGSPSQIWRGWRGVRGNGHAAALRMRFNSNATRPSWISTRWTYINGGQI